MKKNFCLLFFLTLFFAGCAIGPVYREPQMQIPCTWQGGISSNFNCTFSEEFIWWECLGDSTLNELMSCAASQNLDLKIAAIRVLQARTLTKGRKWDLYPHIDGSLSFGHAYYSKDALVNGLLGTALSVNSDDVKRNVDFYELGIDAEWELDFFGLTTHEIAALKAEEESVQESLCGVWVTLSAEIAKNYIELRGLQNRLEISKENLEAETQILNLTYELLERGIVNERDYNKIQAEWSVLNAEQFLIELNISNAIHRLSILLGYSPGDLYQLLCNCDKLPDLPLELFIGIPSELLRRRPDIRKAERDLAAATERIGSAIAALFPRFSLFGFAGQISTQAGSLFSPASTMWLAGSKVLVPIFNSRLILQDIKYNRLETQAALYLYQKTVLQALEETENAIASYRDEEERLCNYIEAYQNYQNNLTFTCELYERGLINNFEVMRAKKNSLSAEDIMVQSQVTHLLNYVSLYKALGGSWKGGCIPLEISP